MLDTTLLDQMDLTTINALDTYNKYAALHYATRNDHVDAMRFLLQAGADANVVDGDGNTPLYYGKCTLFWNRISFSLSH